MHLRRVLAYLLALALVVAVVFAATRGLPLALAQAPASARAAAGPTTFTDPFAYCAAVKTIDAPDSRYTGPAVPEVIARALQAGDVMPNEVLPAGPAEASYLQHSVWRCAGGQVYACYAGSNIPCTQKAETQRVPHKEMLAFCAANPDNPTIPASVTGLTTIYQWHCAHGVPQVLKQFSRADSRGYVAHLWSPVTPGQAAVQ